MAQIFGDQQHIHLLQEVKLRGPDGEPLNLAYRTTTTNILLGAGMKREGYVLQPIGDARHIITLSDAEIKQYQAQGALPKPLPEYKPSAGELLQAYSLWVVLAIVLPLALWAWLEGRKKERLAGRSGGPARDHHNVIRTERID